MQRDVEQYMTMVKELEKLLPVSAVRNDKAKRNDAEEFLRYFPRQSDIAVQNVGAV